MKHPTKLVRDMIGRNNTDVKNKHLDLLSNMIGVKMLNYLIIK